MAWSVLTRHEAAFVAGFLLIRNEYITMHSLKLAFSILTMTICGQVLATPLDLWQTEGWKQIADDDGVYENGFVDPGWGGQAFDAEYLYYKRSGNTLFLGIQTGFDMIDGHYATGGRNYYAGDLAFSLDGDSSHYEYGVDFGLLTKTYFDPGTRSYNPTPIDADNDGDGYDEAGVYSVSQWNNDIYYNSVSAPYAIDGGSLISPLITNIGGMSGDIFYRTVSFDISQFLEGSDLSLDLHWTMSCGNDEINGHAEVPEPETLALFAIGLLGVGVRKRQKI